MSPAVLTALFHTGAMIIVGGSAYVIATQAKKSKNYYHFAATVKSGGVYIGKGLSKAAAVSRIKSKKDTKQRELQLLLIQVVNQLMK